MDIKVLTIKYEDPLSLRLQKRIEKNKSRNVVD